MRSPSGPVLLGEPGRDLVLVRLRHALDQRPVDLPRRARAERLRRASGRKARARDDQDARRVAVEAVDQARLLALAVAQRLEHGVDMAREARAALHGQPRRLVEDEDLVVLVEEERAQEIGIAGTPSRLRRGGPLRSPARHGGRGREPAARRSRGSAVAPRRLPGSAPRRRGDRVARPLPGTPEAAARAPPAPVDSRVFVLTRPPSTRTWPERISFCRCPKPRSGIMRLEPAVEAHSGLVRLDGSGFDARHEMSRSDGCGLIPVISDQ